MRHTIVLSEAGEAGLRRMARGAGKDEEAVLRDLAESILRDSALRRENVPIRLTAGVLGGDACIRDTRIPVWTLVAFKASGMSNREILDEYPGLDDADLVAAWDYYAANAERVDGERRRHEEAD